jgi:hypothetical protein
MVAIFTGIFLLALAVFVLAQHWFKRVRAHSGKRPAGAGGVANSQTVTRTSRSHGSLDSTSLRPRSCRASETLEFSIPSLRLLEEEARQLREMADHVLVDADNAEREVEALLGLDADNAQREVGVIRENER